jgi:chromosome segregation ATPase
MLSTAGFAALFAIMAPVSLASGADTGPSPQDDAAQMLNSTVASCNNSQDERFQAQQAQFERERQQNQILLMQYEGQNDAMHRQYDDLRANYALLEAQNEQVRKQNEDLQQDQQDIQQKYQAMQQQLQDVQQKYDAILKPSRKR